MSQLAPGTSPVATAIVDRPMPGVEAWKNAKNGFSVINLSFIADPRKRDPNWIAEAKTGLPTAEWEREYGETWIVYDGKPVYADFDEANIVRGTIYAPKRARLLSGWDAGPNDVNLAWAIGIVIPGEQRVTIIDEYYVDDGDQEDFVQVVGSRIRLEWTKLGGFNLHVADQSVFTKTGAARQAFADVMRQHGMAPIPGEIAFSRRRAAVERLIVNSPKAIDGVKRPQLMIHERCTMTIEAMLGGYHYPKAMGGIGGAYKETPLKNKFSHLANCVEYICSRLDAIDVSIPFEGRPLPMKALI